MSKLIDADILIKEISDSFDGYMTEDNQLTPQDVVWKLEEQPTIHAIPIDAVKKAREEISKASRDSYEELAQTFYNDAIKDAVEILDKLIAESEG